MQLRTLALASFAALAACNNATPETVEETGVTTAAATATRLYASEGTHELSFETLGTFETRNGGRVLVIRGTTNRYI